MAVNRDSVEDEEASEDDWAANPSADYQPKGRGRGVMGDNCDF